VFKNKWKHSLMTLVIVPALVMGGNLAAADNQVSSRVEVKLKVGAVQAIVNGQATTIEKPYLLKGVTMIPLSVLTSAFGVQLQWDNQTQTIELTQGQKRVQLKIGSNVAVINGKNQALPAAPEMKNGKTMIPLQVATLGLGLQVSTDAKSGQIAISGAASEKPAASAHTLDSDVGKTKIGDSYYGWSMKYPTGLVKNYQSFKGDYVNFKDSKGNFWLSIRVAIDQPGNLSGDGLVKKLTDNLTDTILSKGYVTEGKHPYARAITRDDEGTVTEERAYLSQDKIYYVSFTFNNEEDLRNPLKYKGYKDLLDSFVPAFDKQDPAIKDLSTVENNYRWFTHEDYGLKFKVPAEWEQNERYDFIYFHNTDNTQWVKVKVTSVEKGVTLDDWMKKHEESYREELTNDYLKVDPEIVSSTVAGVPAKERRYSTSLGARWYPEHDIFLYKGNYKYYIEIAYDESDQAKSDAMIETIKRSLAIQPEKMNQALGHIQDQDLIDRNRMATFRNSTYNYSINIPEHWTETESMPDFRRYSYYGADFAITVIESSQTAVREYVLDQISEKKDEYTYRVLENTSMKIGGITGYKIVAEGKNAEVDFVEEFYIVQKGKYTYLLLSDMREAVRTSQNLERLQKVVESFTVLD